MFLNKTRLFLVGLMLLAVNTGLVADQLATRNGNLFTGRILESGDRSVWMAVKSAVLKRSQVRELMTLLEAPAGAGAGQIIVELKNGQQFTGRLVSEKKKRFVFNDTGLGAGDYPVEKGRVARFVKMAWVRALDTSGRSLTGQIFRKGDTRIVLVNIQTAPNGIAFHREEILEITGDQGVGNALSEKSLRIFAGPVYLFPGGVYSSSTKHGPGVYAGGEFAVAGTEAWLPRPRTSYLSYYFRGGPLGLDHHSLSLGLQWRFPVFSDVLWVSAGAAAGPALERVANRGEYLGTQWVLSYHFPLELVWQFGNWELVALFVSATSHDPAYPLTSLGGGLRVGYRL